MTHLQALHVTSSCWAIFIVFWLLAALNVKRTTEKWSSGTGLAYLLVSIVIYNLLFRTNFLGAALLIPHDRGISLIAGATAVVGLAITLWARIMLGRNWSGSITHKLDHELVERGPYRFVRHPIYTGMLLMVIGSALVRGTGDATAAIILFTAVHIWKLRQEEALMTRYFPDAYPAYRERTRALVPFLY